jgi:hypothetical protein
MFQGESGGKSAVCRNPDHAKMCGDQKQKREKKRVVGQLALSYPGARSKQTSKMEKYSMLIDKKIRKPKVIKTQENAAGGYTTQ